MPFSRRSTPNVKLWSWTRFSGSRLSHFANVVITQTPPQSSPSPISTTSCSLKDSIQSSSTRTAWQLNSSSSIRPHCQQQRRQRCIISRLTLTVDQWRQPRSRIRLLNSISSSQSSLSHIRARWTALRWPLSNNNNSKMVFPFRSWWWAWSRPSIIRLNQHSEVLIPALPGMPVVFSYIINNTKLLFTKQTFDHMLS